MNQALPGSENPVTIPGRGGTSPIGTSSPNSGGAANTNSSYAVGAFTSGVNEQATAVTYSVQNTDYGGYIVFQTSSAITITLNQAVGTNFTTTILNIGSGAITLTPNGGLLVNGSSSLTLASGQGVQVFFANRAWKAYAGTTVAGPTFHHDQLTGPGTGWSLTYSPTAGGLMIVMGVIAGFGLIGLSLGSGAVYGYSITGSTITTVSSFPALEVWYT
jgi:hypothetical protein